VALIVGLLIYATGLPDSGRADRLDTQRTGPQAALGTQARRDSTSPSLSPRSQTGSPRAPLVGAVGTAQAQASVGEAVEKLRALYGFAGSLNQAEARALIERRRTATDAIVALA
jgi:hypothetical protein